MAANVKTFRTGQHLFKEGEPSRCMFLIKKGTVSIRKSKGQAFIEIAKIFSNEVLGELSFFDRLPRSASAVALTDVEVLQIDFDSLDSIYVKVPDYMKTIIAAVAERLRKANDTIRRLQKDVIVDPRLLKAEEDDVAAVVAAAPNVSIDGGIVAAPTEEKPAESADAAAAAVPAGNPSDQDSGSDTPA